MEDNLKLNIYERFLISKDNIIIEVNKDFLKLTGYTKDEVMGKTLVEVSKILRIDSQVNLQDIEADGTIFLFTKELVAIEGKISCEFIDDGIQKVFSFKMDFLNLANERFNLADQLGTIRGDGVAIFSFSNLVLVNSNQNYLDFIGPPYNKRINSIGENAIDILPKSSYSLLNKMRNYVFNTGSTFYTEEKRVDYGFLGETYWNPILVPILENQHIKYLILSVSNVTEKVLNRKMIEQRNEELGAVIENISDEIIIFDKDNQVIQFEDFPFRRVMRGEIVSEYIIKIKGPVEVLHRDVNGTPIYNKEGKFSGGVMIYRDIKNRLETEEARLIKIQNELLSKVVESLDLEFIRCSYPDFKIISINVNGSNKLKRINNGNKPLVCPIGKNYFDMYNVNEESKRKDLYYNLIENEKFSYINYETHIMDGEERFFKTVNQPIFGLNNKIVELILISIDITDEVKAKNKVEETLEMQNQMFSTISHELKTPLSLIFGASQLIELDLKKEIDKISKDDIKRSVDIIKQNCYRFTKLINNIIDLSRMESGFFKLNFINGNIIEIVEDIVDSVRSYVENKGLHIIFDTEIEEKIIAVDVDKIERIILNLISNATKFSPKGSNIYIEIKYGLGFVSILVRDSGVGIKGEYLSTIFDKYKKLDNTLVRNAEGSGIGLALVKTMIDLIDGEISAESEFGKGSLFTVKLPVKIVDESEVIKTIQHSDNRIEQINIEFSDIYPK